MCAGTVRTKVNTTQDNLFRRRRFNEGGGLDALHPETNGLLERDRSRPAANRSLARYRTFAARRRRPLRTASPRRSARSAARRKRRRGIAPGPRNVRSGAAGSRTISHPLGTAPADLLALEVRLPVVAARVGVAVGAIEATTSWAGTDGQSSAPTALACLSRPAAARYALSLASSWAPRPSSSGLSAGGTGKGAASAAGAAIAPAVLITTGSAAGVPTAGANAAIMVATTDRRDIMGTDGSEIAGRLAGRHGPMRRRVDAGVYGRSQGKLARGALAV
jgi:hypothetical protein